MQAAQSVLRSRFGISSAATAPSSWIMPIGDRISAQADIAQLLATQQREIEEAGCVVEVIEDEDGALPPHGSRHRRRQGRRLVSGPHGMGTASARQSLDPLRSAPRRYEGNPQCQDQAARSRFVPSRLRCSREAVAEWFEEDDDVPFMMQVFQIRKDKRPLIPAVTHVDGSGRLQTVHQADKSRLSTELSRAFAILPACPWCSTRRSTRMSRWSANPRRRSTASCARKWTCWYWITSWWPVIRD